MQNRADGEHILSFGKWRNASIENVPREYLRYLCLWDNYKNTQKLMLETEGQRWLFRYHPETVEAARSYVKARKLCRECFRPLVPVGNARVNGKSHRDWGSRNYHKCCWRILDVDTESDTDM